MDEIETERRVYAMMEDYALQFSSSDATMLCEDFTPRFLALVGEIMLNYLQNGTSERYLEKYGKIAASELLYAIEKHTDYMSKICRENAANVELDAGYKGDV